MTRVLVAYATKMHGTKGIADELARHPVWLFESGWVGKKPPGRARSPMR